MSHVYITSDWHFGHEGITRFRTGMGSREQLEQYILGRALGYVTKRDVMFCLGDMAFTSEGLNLMRELPCRLILIRGNHDTLPTHEYMSLFQEVHGAYRYKRAWLTHIPIHPMELYRGYNIHGHCHRGGPYEVRQGDQWWMYYNAILEYNDYAPVNLRDVLEELQRREREHSNEV